ncbi:MAG: hypothetical protein C0600_06165 [Ignavibacteria bacterium]|nr:MAG: hypothetical protein C0600_06165 [Ignavibacteria bacterium]
MKLPAMLRAFAGLFVIACLTFALTACEGEKGETGPAGPAGDNGAQGLQGEKGDKGDQGDPGMDGADGTTGCVQCHDVSDKVKSVSVQYANSKHGSGTTFERNGTSCAPCHVSQGFTEVLQTGQGTTAASISNPAPVNCRTCHNIHLNYDETDYALVTSDPVTFQDNKTFDMGKANLCAHCHKPRPVTLPEVGGPDYEVTSKRFGPHHGPQSSLLAGAMGVEIPGTVSWTANNPHRNIPDGCLTCHMAEAYGGQSGGHVMSMGYEYHEELVPNTAGCEDCHGELDDFDYNGWVTEYEGLMAQLRQLLIDKGALLDDDYAVTGTFSAALASALYNYRYLLEDRSDGIHNPRYAKAMLQNSIEAIQ